MLVPTRTWVPACTPRIGVLAAAARRQSRLYRRSILASPPLARNSDANLPEQHELVSAAVAA